MHLQGPAVTPEVDRGIGSGVGDGNGSGSGVGDGNGSGNGVGDGNGMLAPRLTLA